MPLSPYFQMPGEEEIDPTLLMPEEPPAAAEPQAPYARTADMQEDDFGTAKAKAYETVLNAQPSQYGKMISTVGKQNPHAFQTGMDKYESNKVSPEDVEAQSERARLYDFLGSLEQSANQVGAIGGKIAKSDLGEFAKSLNQQDKDRMAKRQLIADSGRKDAMDSLSLAKMGDDYQSTQNQRKLAAMTSYSAMQKNQNMMKAAEEKRKADMMSDQALISYLRQRGMDVPDGMDPQAAKDIYFKQEDQKFKERQAASERSARLKEKAMEREAKGSAAEGKPATQEQLTAAGFSKRLENANKELEDLESAGTGLSNMVTSHLPNAMQSSEKRRLENAKIDFVTAQLRKESGAAISPDEFKMADMLYFPQPGDDPQTLAQKRSSTLR